MAELLRGKPVAEAIYADLAGRIEGLRAHKVHPRLALVRVGEDAADAAYQRSILAQAERVGVKVDVHELPADASRFAVESIIEGVNVDRAVHGCMLFRPLPKGIDELALCNMIAPQKDVDGVGARSLAGVFMGAREGFAPCTAQACVEMLEHHGVQLAGKHAVVVGRSLVVGKPAAMLLLARDATVTLCHSGTADVAAQMRAADIVVCATGRARAFGSDCFCPGQVVVDVGTNTDADGIFCGDVDFDAAEPLVSAITPVPGGLGAVTTAVLLAHVVESAERRS